MRTACYKEKVSTLVQKIKSFIAVNLIIQSRNRVLSTHLHKSTFNKLGKKYYSSRTLHQTPATPRGDNSHVVEEFLSM